MNDLAILARSHLREQGHEKLFGHRWVEIADVERSRVVVILEWRVHVVHEQSVNDDLLGKNRLTTSDRQDRKISVRYVSFVHVCNHLSSHPYTSLVSTDHRCLTSTVLLCQPHR